MNKCKTCAHWGSVTANGSSAYKVGGYCQSDKIGEQYNLEFPSDALVYSYSEGGSFWTGPEFGCVHWSSK